jgi:hypothetical protein
MSCNNYHSHCSSKTIYLMQRLSLRMLICLQLCVRSNWFIVWSYYNFYAACSRQYSSRFCVQRRRIYGLADHSFNFAQSSNEFHIYAYNLV